MTTDRVEASEALSMLHGELATAEADCERGWNGQASGGEWAKATGRRDAFRRAIRIVETAPSAAHRLLRDDVAQTIYTAWTGVNYKPWHNADPDTESDDWQSALRAADAIIGAPLSPATHTDVNDHADRAGALRAATPTHSAGDSR